MVLDFGLGDEGCMIEKLVIKGDIDLLMLKEVVGVAPLLMATEMS